MLVSKVVAADLAGAGCGGHDAKMVSEMVVVSARGGS
jgi:hypothetical protein